MPTNNTAMNGLMDAPPKSKMATMTNMAFNCVANWADLKYGYMTNDIRTKQTEIEEKELAMQPAIDTAALRLHAKDPDLARQYLTEYCEDNARRVLKEWWALADALVVKYDDGYINNPHDMAGLVGYPKWWRNQVGYSNGPTSYENRKER